jgi:hypothetical protein
MSTATTTPPKQDGEDPILARLHRLVQRAEEGDESALPELRAALDMNGWAWQDYGNLGRQSEAAWLQLIAGKNLMLHESTRRKAAQLRAELAGPGPSQLERLLIERIVSCWLQVHYADASYAQLKGTTPAQHAAALRRQDSAQQRYLQSVRALATVRRLLRPAPAPVEIATRLGSQERGTAGRRDLSPAQGVAVEN